MMVGWGEEGFAVQPLVLSKIWCVKGMILPFLLLPTVANLRSLLQMIPWSWLPMKVEQRLLYMTALLSIVVEELSFLHLLLLLLLWPHSPQ